MCSVLFRTHCIPSLLFCSMFITHPGKWHERDIYRLSILKASQERLNKGRVTDIICPVPKLPLAHASEKIRARMITGTAYMNAYGCSGCRLNIMRRQICLYNYEFLYFSSNRVKKSSSELVKVCLLSYQMVKRLEIPLNLNDRGLYTFSKTIASD